MSWKVFFALLLVLFGCCSNVVFLELIVKFDTGAGNIITFFQFLLIALEGLIFEARFFTKKPKIAIKYYVLMVGLFFTVSIVNNYCLHFHIPLPLHMIFRSGSLMANMVLGVVILRKKYSYSKYLSILMISVGIAMATIASANQEYNKGSAPSEAPLNEEDDLLVETVHDGVSDLSDEGHVTNFMWLCVGVVLLLIALFMSAALGILQEVIYSRFGKFPKEAMFYTHALPLPLFLLMAPDIIKRAAMFTSSDPILIGGVAIPSMWLYLILNSITQYICISGVFTLTTECPSLVVTLVVTLRKFLSLLFSIIYFQNPFTLVHWMGTGLVFTGTLLFTEIINNIIPTRRTWLTEKKKQT